MWKKWVRLHLYAPMRALNSGREIRRYLATAERPRINIGCGKNLPQGWLNVDLYPHVGASHMDVGSVWPVPEGSFDACLCEHVIEHIPKPLGREVLAQAFRALRPGGTLRLVTPNLEFFGQLILGQRSERDQRVYEAGLKQVLGVTTSSRCDIVNLIFYEHGHRYIYTPGELSDLLASVGFVDVAETPAGEPRDPIFAGAEGHADVVNNAFNVMEAFALEARRPPVSQPATVRRARHLEPA